MKKKMIVAAMLLAMLPTSTASAGLFDFLKKKGNATVQERRDAAKKRVSAAKERFQKKMAERRKNSSLAKKFAQKERIRARSKTAQNYVKKRSAMYPAAPTR
jgi:hypothetical protein